MRRPREVWNRLDSRARTGLDTAARRYSWLRFVVEVGRRDRDIAGRLLAAALAFRVFIWLLPCALLLAGLLGFSASSEHTPEDLAKNLGLSPLTGSLLGQVGQQAVRSRYLTVTIGAGLLCVASFSLGKAFDGVHARIWPGTRQSGIRRSAVRAVCYSGVLLAIVATCVFGPILRSAAGVPGVVTSLVSLALFGVLGGVLFGIGRPPACRSVLAGTVLFAVGLEGLRLIAIYFLPGRLTRASELYGTLGIAAALLIWLTLVARLIVLGHLLNAVLSDVK